MSSPTKDNLYRKYRPRQFAELLGQDPITRTLRASVTTGRVAHAYLFSGPRGTGKTSAARLMAKVLNCRSPITVDGVIDACASCDVCERIEQLAFLDLVEIDAASNNGVDDIRQMREKVKFLPAEGKVKVYIIDEVHMLSTSAFNAFLKTLEEPPPRVVFILATTDPQKVPATIVSRCQHFDFHPISRKCMVERLAEVVRLERAADPGFPEASTEVLVQIAELAEGGFRDALSLLDQVTVAAPGARIDADQVLALTHRLGFRAVRDLAATIFTRDAAGVLTGLGELFHRGYEPITVGKDLLDHFRRCLLLQVGGDLTAVMELSSEQAAEIRQQLGGVPTELLMAICARFERVLSLLRGSASPRLLLEVELVRMARRELALGLDGIERRVGDLEAKIATPSLRLVPVATGAAAVGMSTVVPVGPAVAEARPTTGAAPASRATPATAGVAGDPPVKALRPDETRNDIETQNLGQRSDRVTSAHDGAGSRMTAAVGADDRGAHGEETGGDTGGADDDDGELESAPDDRWAVARSSGEPTTPATEAIGTARMTPERWTRFRQRLAGLDARLAAYFGAVRWENRGPAAMVLWCDPILAARLGDPAVRRRFLPALTAELGGEVEVSVEVPVAGGDAAMTGPMGGGSAAPGAGGERLKDAIQRVDAAARERVLAKPAVADAMAIFAAECIKIER